MVLEENDIAMHVANTPSQRVRKFNFYAGMKMIGLSIRPGVAGLTCYSSTMVGKAFGHSPLFFTWEVQSRHITPRTLFL